MRSKSRYKSWPILLTAVLLIVSMIGITPSKQVVEKVVEQTSSMEFQVNSFETEYIYETAEEVAKRVQSEFEVGKSTSVEEGVKYYSSSDYETNKNAIYGTFGGSYRDAGDYTVDRISVLLNGSIVKVESADGANLGDVVSSTASSLGVSADELSVRLHLGGPVSGWVDVTDLLNEENLTPQIVGEKTVLDNNYSGIVENFNGTISFMGANGMVNLNVLDQNGSILPEGSVVVGSDNQQYRLENMKLESVENVTENVVDVPAKVTFGVQNLTALETFSSIAVGLIAAHLSKEKEEKEKRVTEKEYEEILRNAKEKYDSKSKFVRLVNKLRGKKPNWERINFYADPKGIEVEKISELYDEEIGGPKL